MWGQLAGIDNYKDIFLVEAIGPLLGLEVFPNLVKDALWIHFIDNSGAEASLVSGSSSIDAGDHIVGMTWERIAKRRLWPFFDCPKQGETDGQTIERRGSGTLAESD